MPVHRHVHGLSCTLQCAREPARRRRSLTRLILLPCCRPLSASRPPTRPRTSGHQQATAAADSVGARAAGDAGAEEARGGGKGRCGVSLPHPCLPLLRASQLFSPRLCAPELPPTACSSLFRCLAWLFLPFPRPLPMPSPGALLCALVRWAIQRARASPRGILTTRPAARALSCSWRHSIPARNPCLLLALSVSPPLPTPDFTAQQPKQPPSPLLSENEKQQQSLER